MSRFLGLVQLTPAGAAALCREGLAHHRAFLTDLLDVSGGTLEQLWTSNGGEWDLVMIVDVPGATPSQGSAATLVRRANGQHAVERWIQLVDTDETDAALRASGHAAG